MTAESYKMKQKTKRNKLNFCGFYFDSIVVEFYVHWFLEAGAKIVVVSFIYMPRDCTAAIRRERSSDCVPQVAQHVNILCAMHYAGISGVLWLN